MKRLLAIGVLLVPLLFVGCVSPKTTTARIVFRAPPQEGTWMIVALKNASALRVNGASWEIPNYNGNDKQTEAVEWSKQEGARIIFKTKRTLPSYFDLRHHAHLQWSIWSGWKWIC